MDEYNSDLQGINKANKATNKITGITEFLKWNLTLWKF